MKAWLSILRELFDRDGAVSLFGSLLSGIALFYILISVFDSSSTSVASLIIAAIAFVLGLWIECKVKGAEYLRYSVLHSIGHTAYFVGFFYLIAGLLHFVSHDSTLLFIALVFGIMGKLLQIRALRLIQDYGARQVKATFQTENRYSGASLDV
jgi:uncharacterized membrane protein